MFSVSIYYKCSKVRDVNEGRKTVPTWYNAIPKLLFAARLSFIVLFLLDCLFVENPVKPSQN